MTNKPKHTPGPWTAEQDGNIYDIRSGGFTPCTTNAIDAETDAANAALIAAAPELLAQLKQLYAAHKFSLDTGAAYVVDEMVVTFIAAAIAKAEGGQSCLK